MRRRPLALACLAALLPGAARSQESAPVVLSVGGAVRTPLELTMEALEALGTERVRTVTAWTQGPQNFSGVPLARVVRAAGGEGATSLRAEALNRYAVSVPMEDAWENGAVLATRLDSRPMRVRDRGPVWLIYPWSERPALDRPEVNERAIWQLRRLELR